MNYEIIYSYYDGRVDYFTPNSKIVTHSKFAGLPT